MPSDILKVTGQQIPDRRVVVAHPGGNLIGLSFQSAELSPKWLEWLNGAVAAAQAAQADGLVILATRLFTQEAPRLAALVTSHWLPAIYLHRRFAEAGGLLAYGPNESDPQWGYRRAAYVDKILKEAKPTDLPVEQPTKFELVINLKTAQALGLMIPPSLLFQADEVIR